MPAARRPTAVVTGAGAPDGIGIAAAHRLVATGIDVVVVATSDRIHARADELARSAVLAGQRTTGVIADLRDPDAVTRMFADLGASGARVDVLVNNAGMASVAAGTDAARPLESLTLGQWDDTVTRNLSTAFLVCRAAVPGMRRRRYGRIVNVASTSGPVAAFERGSAYAAAKAGMVGMTRALALEVARHGITVNAVAPGWIDTGSATASERRAGAASPIGRSGRPEEVAAAIEFLASPSASYVTGTLLVVDGGNAVQEDHGRG